MRRGRTTNVLMLLVAALALALFAGCGGDSDSESETSAPQAEQSLDDAVAELNRVIREQDCDGFVALTYSALRINAAGDGPADAGEPVRPEECEENGADALLEDLKGTTFEESKDFGAAAFAEGSGGKPVAGYDRWTVTFLADRDGQWRDIGFVPADPQFAEEMNEDADPVGVAEQLVDAVKTGDCANADEFLLDRLRFGDTPREACEALAQGTIFAPALRSAEDVTVEEIGRIRDYAIVGVDTGRTYFAVQLSTPPIAPNKPPQAKLLVIDVLPMTDFVIVEPPEDQQEQ
jgi:hypothetical protein